MKYLRQANQILRRSYLPDDLLRSARRAEEAGDAAQMRAAYARFLLQQSMVPASERQAIHEAYLKLGDSYRMQAERFGGDAGDEPQAKPSREAQTPPAAGDRGAAREGPAGSRDGHGEGH